MKLQINQLVAAYQPNQRLTVAAEGSSQCCLNTTTVLKPTQHLNAAVSECISCMCGIDKKLVMLVLGSTNSRLDAWFGLASAA